jgi:uncharacterized membrane protein
MTGIDTSVQVAIVTGVFGLLAALTGLLMEALRRQGKAIGETREHANATREQVQNSHTSTNLRDDVDQVLAALQRIEQTQRQYDTDINGVREEIRHERVERLDLERRVDRIADRG